MCCKPQVRGEVRTVAKTHGVQDRCVDDVQQTLRDVPPEVGLIIAKALEDLKQSRQRLAVLQSEGLTLAVADVDRQDRVGPPRARLLTAFTSKPPGSLKPLVA